jgi:hypothetical protein
MPHQSAAGYDWQSPGLGSAEITLLPLADVAAFRTLSFRYAKSTQHLVPIAAVHAHIGGEGQKEVAHLVAHQISALFHFSVLLKDCFAIEENLFEMLENIHHRLVKSGIVGESNLCEAGAIQPSDCR